MKKIFKLLTLALMATFALASCEDVPEPYPNPNPNENGGGEEQVVEPIGDGSLASPYNVAGVIAYINGLGADVESTEAVYIKGKVKANSTTESTISQYGNMTFTMVDEGNTTTTFTAFQVYGPDKKKFTAVDQIKEGDEVVVYGKVVNYKGNTPETVGKGQAYVVSINGAGGSDQPDQPAGEAKGDGTLANPYNVAGVNAYLDGAYDDTKEVYFTGIISKFKSGEEPGNSYGNSTFYISEDGQTGGEDFYCYRIFGLNGEKFTSADQLKVGDLVVVKSPVTVYTSSYGSTKETVQNKGQLVSVNGKEAYSNGQTSQGGNNDQPDQPTTGEAKGDGTQANPYNVAAIINLASSLSEGVNSDKVYFKGIVSRTTDISANYGNATFYISENGKAENEFYVFRCKGLDNKNIASSDDVKVGDEVVIYGQVTNYKGNTPETVQNEAYIFSLTRPEGGSDTPGQGGNDDIPEGDLNFAASALGLTNGTAFNSITYQGVTLTVDGGGNQNTPKYYDSGSNLRMYPKNSLTIESGKKIASVKLTCTSGSVAGGEVSATPGSINVEDPVITISGINSTSVKITNNSGTTGAVSQIRIVKFEITYAE